MHLDTTYSFIIPFYNAEKTIERCLNSLMQETESDYEIILINDGSTDSSMQIVDDFIARHKEKNIQVYHQNNSGPSRARNFGIDIANNDILCFVDSDDYISPEYLNTLNEIFSKSDVDVVFFSYYRETCYNNYINLTPSNTLQDYYSKLCELSKSDTFGYPWVKAIRKSKLGIVKFDERFDLFEDEIFTIDLLKTYKKIAIISDPIYHYCIQDNSLSQSVRNEYPLYLDSVYRKWKDLLPISNDLFLVEKANHFSKISYYYGIEKRVDINKYFRYYIKSQYYNDSTIKPVKVKNKILITYFVRKKIKYSLKNKIYNIIHNKKVDKDF